MMLTAFLLGLAGSMHCAGMCSPLAIAVTSYRNPTFLKRILYNSGRIVSYGILGALISTIGSLFNFPILQNVFSLALGSILILFGITGLGHFKVPVVTSTLTQVSLFIKTLFKKFLSKKNIPAIVMLGMINGLLPCGLTYLALSYCILLPAATDGFIFMILFGAGTLPVMLGLTSAIQFLIKRFNLTYQKITTITLITLGVLLISRTLLEHNHLQPKTATGAIVTVCE